MTLTKEQHKVIADYPLNNLLSRFLDKLYYLDRSKDTQRSNITTILSILVRSSIVFNFYLLNRNSNIAGRLIPIPQKVQRGSLKYDHFRPLTNAVALNSPNNNIQTTVINLINAINLSIPPLASIIPTSYGILVKSSSSRLKDSKTHDIIKLKLFYKIKDYTHQGVPRFFEKHFNIANQTKAQAKMLKLILTNYDRTKQKDFPANPQELAIQKQLQGLEETALARAQYILYTNKSATKFKAHKGQIDIFFQKPKRTEGRFKYKHILVAREHKRSFMTTDFKAYILQLTQHIQNIFTNQPIHRFVHTFTIRATIIKLQIYDRSSAYSSGEFNIHHKPGKLAHTLIAYATIDDTTIGLDISIKQKNSHYYVIIEDSNGNNKRVELNGLLVQQRAVVCRGTTCFSTRHGVAKFS